MLNQVQIKNLNRTVNREENFSNSKFEFWFHKIIIFFDKKSRELLKIKLGKFNSRDKCQFGGPLILWFLSIKFRLKILNSWNRKFLRITRIWIEWKKVSRQKAEFRWRPLRFSKIYSSFKKFHKFFLIYLKKYSTCLITSPWKYFCLIK